MKLKKKNKLKKIVFICVILIFLLIVLIKLIEKKQEQQDEINENKAIIEQQINDYFSDKICPQNTLILNSNYKGKNSKNDLYRNFKVFVDDLPSFISNIKDKQENELLEYFEKNKDYIYKYLGIESKEEFLELSKYIQTKSIDGNLFEYCEIEATSFKTEDEGKYLTFNVKFYFKNNIDNLNFKISFANYEKTKPQVKYNVAY